MKGEGSNPAAPVSLAVRGEKGWESLVRRTAFAVGLVETVVDFSERARSIAESHPHQGGPGALTGCPAAFFSTSLGSVQEETPEREEVSDRPKSQLACLTATCPVA